MISFIRGTLLKEEPCCKFILKLGVKITSDNLRKLKSFVFSEI